MDLRLPAQLLLVLLQKLRLLGQAFQRVPQQLCEVCVLRAAA